MLFTATFSVFAFFLVSRTGRGGFVFQQRILLDARGLFPLWLIRFDGRKLRFALRPSETEIDYVALFRKGVRHCFRQHRTVIPLAVDGITRRDTDFS